MNKSVHILRYGTVGEKAHLEKAISTYDYLSINGNSAAYVSSAIAKFVVEKFFNDESKGFFIDPITYAFQNNIHLLRSTSKAGEPTIKKSIVKLIEAYGNPIDKVFSGAVVTPSDFSEDNIAQQFCRRVLSFQYSVIRDYIREKDLEKYLLYVADIPSLDAVNQLRPKILIPPYFYLNPRDSNFEKWLYLNVNFINISLSQSHNYFGSIPVYGQIVLSKESLQDKKFINQIANAYQNCACAGFTIWIDGLNEHEADIGTLKSFTELLGKLKGKAIYNMYGGYFSILLTHSSIGLLQGVSHGMEYGESREVYPVGGGIPVSKYYYMPLHQRIDFTKAFYFLEYNGILDTNLENWGTCDKYYNEICKCEQCNKIMEDSMINFVKFESDQFYEVKRKNSITRRKKASSETKENCLYHFLLCKKMEFTMVKKRKLSELLDRLKSEKKRYQNCSFINVGELDYLDNWVKVLVQFR